MLSDYIVPDYYPNFVCKCGECRHVCCHGWDVALPMNEYYRLLGLECTPEIRRKLDIAMRVVDNPRPERYAIFAKGYDGGCPMHDEDGLCMLQKSMGEGVLPNICRLYPRHHSHRYGNECSCSAGCENTVELLIKSNAPLSFVHMQTEREDVATKPGDEFTAGHYDAVRDACFKLISDRSVPLPSRLLALSDFTSAVSAAISAKDSDEATRLTQTAPVLSDILRDENDTAVALDIIELIVTHFVRISPNLEVYGIPALDSVALDGEGITETNISLYRERLKRFESLYPDYEIHLEKMLANHIFHEGYPFSDQFENTRHANVALSATYALLKFILVCSTDESSGIDGFVDVASAVFRMVESSAFGVRAVILLHNERFDSVEQIRSLVVGV